MQELSMNILDIAENSIRAGATLVEIRLELQGSKLTISIRDNGCGMSPELLNKVTDPFTTSRTTRKVGLGLPFYKMAAEMTGGTMQIESRLSVGTAVTATFFLSHIDCMPLGDLGATVATLMQCNPDIDFVFSLSDGAESFAADSRQFREILGGVPLSTPEVAFFIREYVSEHIKPILEKGI